MENEERPHDYEAERAILCAILHDNAALDSLTLEPRDFHDGQHKAIFEAMLVLRESGRGVDTITVYDAMRPHQAGVGSVLAQLGAESFSAAFVKDYARIVKEKSTKRQMLDQLPALAAQFHNGADPIQLRAEWDKAGALLEIPETTAELFIRPSELLDMPDIPIPWTVHELIPNAALTIIAAEPGAGKSTWLRSLAISVAQGRPFQGRAVRQGPVIIFCLEEFRAMVVKHLRQMDMQRDDPLHVRFDPLDDALSQLRAAIQRIKPMLVIVDPLPKFIEINDLDRYGQVSPAMQELVNIAHEAEGTNIVAVQHVNKAGKTSGPVAALPLLPPLT